MPPFSVSGVDVPRRQNNDAMRRFLEALDFDAEGAAEPGVDVAGVRS